LLFVGGERKREELVRVVHVIEGRESGEGDARRSAWKGRVVV